MRFSQRIGKTPIQETIQIDSMTESFENRLLNIVISMIKNISNVGFDTLYVKHKFIEIYADTFGIRINEIPHEIDAFINHIEDKVRTEGGVYFFYDFIQLLVNYLKKIKYPHPVQEIALLLAQLMNVLESEKSAYRFDKDYNLVKITDKVELDEINKAINKVSKYNGVNTHLSNARVFFSDRENPNYNKTISESIDAIESLCKIILSDDSATLGQAVKKLGLHKSLESSISKLYGFASDFSGIRHSNNPSATDVVDEHNAKLILVLSHSIVNYLISKNLNT